MTAHANDWAQIAIDVEAQLTAMGTVTVFDFPPASAVPPFAFVNLPEEITYDATFGRGSDRFTFEVYVCTGAVKDRDSAAALMSWASGAANGVKAWIEASTNFDFRVTNATFANMTLGANLYPCVVFSVDVEA